MSESGSKQRPAIDIDMLTMALQAGDLETGWWLDTQNGDVILAPEPDGDAVEQKLIKEKQRSPDRYIDIKPVADSIHIELMESYTATLEQSEHSQLLSASLQRRQPVWNFKKTLASDPECEDNWYAFKEQFYALQARQWLRDRDLEYTEYITESEDKGASKSGAFGLERSDSLQQCMELVISISVQKRRYVIWQQEDQTLLTVFTQNDKSEEQLLSEVQINNNQLLGFNRMIETYQPFIELEKGVNTLDVTFRFSNAHSKGEIQGCYSKGEMFQQLAMTLDMLLGIPELSDS